VTAITNSTTVGQVLRVTGANAYGWGALDLADTDAITGDLPYANLTPATAASKLLGRGSASGAGDWAEITIGSGLTMTGTTLSASGGGGGIGGSTGSTDNSLLRADGTGGATAQGTGANATLSDGGNLSIADWLDVAHTKGVRGVSGGLMTIQEGSGADTGSINVSASNIGFRNGLTGALEELKFNVRIGVGHAEGYAGSDVSSTSVLTALAAYHDTNLTPAAGYGVNFDFKLKSTTTERREAARLSAVWTTSTDASRTADLLFSTIDSATLAERLRLTGPGVLVLKNATAAPGSGPADSVQLYAEDVSSSSELKVRDEAGNISTLSPHNFSRIPGGPSEEMAWAFYSERNGKYITVDWARMIRLIEKHFGEELLFIGNIGEAV
jgi:hypothetical protein